MLEARQQDRREAQGAHLGLLTESGAVAAAGYEVDEEEAGRILRSHRTQVHYLADNAMVGSWQKRAGQAGPKVCRLPSRISRFAVDADRAGTLHGSALAFDAHLRESAEGQAAWFPRKILDSLARGWRQSPAR